MSLDERTSRLIGDVYEAGADNVRWRRVLDEILARTDSRFALLSVVDLKTSQFSSTRWHGPDDARFLDGTNEYEAELYRTDPTLRFGIANPNGGFVSLKTALASAGEDYDNHFYVKWTRDVLRVGGSIVRYTPPIDGLTLAVSLHPPAANGHHNGDQTRLFLMLFQHIERSVRLTARAPNFESDTDAVLAVNVHRRVVAMSAAAERLLAMVDGLSITKGCLVVSGSPETRSMFDLAMSSALSALEEGTAGGAVSIQRPSGKRPFALTVTPTIFRDDPFAVLGAAALIRIVAPEEGPAQSALARWVALYGVTSAETRLVESLLTGDGNLRRVADRLGIAYATARVQLASIFEKTGVNSQSQLVRLLTRIGSYLISFVASGMTLFSDTALLPV